MAKASKVIPVMLMGKIVSNKKYEFYEYLVAILISLGMVAFMLGKETGGHSDGVTTVSGIIILVGYMSFDSFTSNWQDSLFKVLYFCRILCSCTGFVHLIECSEVVVHKYTTK